MGGEFLEKCLQQVLIQNNCLSRQVASKELELIRLRRHLQNTKEKHAQQSSLFAETDFNIDINMGANNTHAHARHAYTHNGSDVRLDRHRHRPLQQAQASEQNYG